MTQGSRLNFIVPGPKPGPHPQNAGGEGERESDLKFDFDCLWFQDVTSTYGILSNGFNVVVYGTVYGTVRPQICADEAHDHEKKKRAVPRR